MRTANGQARTSCGCKTCVDNCRFMPGHLIPSDVEAFRRRLEGILGHDPTEDEWLGVARGFLRASPGATVAILGDSAHPAGTLRRIPTLVPASHPDHSCVFLTEDRRCGIHADAPFGCAFFDCRTPRAEGDRLSEWGLRMIQADWDCLGLYARTWKHLDAAGLVAEPPSVKRRRMAETLYLESARPAGAGNGG